MHSTPALAEDRIYIGSQDHRVYCVNASTGVVFWTYRTSGPIYSSPTLHDGLLYIGSDDGRLYCLDAITGALAWSYTTGRRIASIPAVAQGRVLVGSSDHFIYCLDAITGAKLWAYETGNTVLASPTIWNDTVIIGSVDGYVYCLNLATGHRLWRFKASTGIYASSAVHANRVFCGDVNGDFYCLNAETGATIWTYQTKGKIAGSPAVADDKVYVTSWGQPGHPSVADGLLYCLNASAGTLIWQYRMNDRISSSPAIAEGRLVIGGFDGNIYCFADVYDVTFSQVGVDADVTGMIVTIDSINYSVTELPITFTWMTGSLHTYAYMSPLDAEPDGIYVWTKTSGLSHRQSETLMITASGNITAWYQPRTRWITDVLHELQDAISTWELPKGPQRSLIGKLDAAQQRLNEGNDEGAVDTLRAVISYVEAQKGKKLSPEQTGQLNDAVQQIINVLLL
jgi:outer membrane protein assembly factor BamB